MRDVANNEEVAELRKLIEGLQREAAKRDEVVERLRSQVEERASLIETLQAEPKELGVSATAPAHSGEPEEPAGQPALSSTSQAVTAGDEAADTITDLAKTRSTRRNMFKAGAALAAAAASTPLLTKSAAAADGGNFIIGQNNVSGGGHTRLNMSGTGDLSNQNIFTVTDALASSSYPAAVGAYAQGDRIYNGLYAYSDDRTTDTSTGHAIVARAGSFARSHVYLPGAGGNPQNDTIAHARGEIRSTGGSLWFCVSSGTPGTWRKVTGPDASGSVHMISPRRAYDSRFVGGPVAAGGSRVLSVANGINVSTGSSTGTLVPTGATGVFINIAIVNTTGVGFLAVTPGDASTFSAASINWSATGQILNNGTASALDSNRQLRVFAGGGNTDFIVDVTGYTL